MNKAYLQNKDLMVSTVSCPCLTLPSSSHADEDSDKARSKQCLVCTTGICFPHDDSEGRNEIRLLMVNV